MTEQERRAAQGQRVKMARAGANLSRQKMAVEVSGRWEKISREYIRRIEEGDVDPGYGFFLAAADVTGQDVEWFTALESAGNPRGDKLREWFRRPIDVYAEGARLAA